MFKVETCDMVESERQAGVLVESFTQADVEGFRTLSATCLGGNRVETSALDPLRSKSHTKRGKCAGDRKLLLEIC